MVVTAACSGTFFHFNIPAELFQLSINLHGYLTVVNPTYPFICSTQTLEPEVRGVKSLSTSYLLCISLAHIPGLGAG